MDLSSRQVLFHRTLLKVTSQRLYRRGMDQGRIQDFSYAGQDFLTSFGGGEKKVLVLKNMLVIKYRLVIEALVSLDSLKSCLVTTIFSHHIWQIQITNDSNYNHDVKWIGWLAWVILYGIPILQKTE